MEESHIPSTENSTFKENERSDEATPVSSRETANGSVDVAKQQIIPPPRIRGWRRGWRNGGPHSVPDDGVPLESVK